VNADSHRSYARDALPDAVLGIVIGVFYLVVSVNVVLSEPTPGVASAGDATLLAGASIMLLLVAGGHLLVGRPPGWLVLLAIGANLLLYVGIETRIVPFFTDWRNLLTHHGILMLIGGYYSLAGVWKLARRGTR
jgi:hypothetical protein